MRYLLILICVVFGGGELCAQPAVAFETKTYDLGEVGEKGGAVSRDFRFENTGDAPLVIIKAETACNCTKSPLFAETGGSGTERYGDGGLRSRQARRLFSESRQNPDEHARKAVYRYDPRKRRSVGGNYRIFDYFCFGPPFDGRVGYLVSDDCGTIDKKLPGASDDGTAGRPKYYRGAVAVSGDRIALVSDSPQRIERYERERGEGLQVADGAGRLVMPGLINLHNHVSMTLMRGYADDLPLMPWLTLKRSGRSRRNWTATIFTAGPSWESPKCCSAVRPLSSICTGMPTGSPRRRSAAESGRSSSPGFRRDGVRRLRRTDAADD